MNTYLRNFFRLADEGLCSEYSVKKVETDNTESVERIKSVLKYRFGLDFDKDVKEFAAKIIGNSQDKKSDINLKSLLSEMIKFLDKKISFKSLYNDVIDVENNIIEYDMPKELLNNKIYYITCNLYLVLLNINCNEYHSNNNFYDSFPDFDNAIKEKTDFASNRLLGNGRDGFKDSFLYALLADEKILTKQKNKSNNPNKWCEANDAVHIASIFSSQKSPYNRKYNVEDNVYKVDTFFEFYSEYNKIYKEIQKYNKKQIEKNYKSNRTQKYEKSDKYIKEDKLPYKYSSDYLSEMIYGFGLIKQILDSINEFSQYSGSKADRFNKRKEEIMELCSYFMVIPDIYNRKIYSDIVVKYIKELCKRHKGKCLKYLLQDLKCKIIRFVVYEVKYYYFILMTYAFLTIDYILKLDSNGDSGSKELRLRNMITKVLSGMQQQQFDEINRDDIPIDNLNCFYKPWRNNVFNESYFSGIINDSLVSQDFDVNLLLSIYIDYTDSYSGYQEWIKDQKTNKSQNSEFSEIQYNKSETNNPDNKN